MKMWLHHAALTQPEIAFTGYQPIADQRTNRVPDWPALRIVSGMINENMLGIVRVIQHNHRGCAEIELVYITIFGMCPLKISQLLADKSRDCADDREALGDGRVCCLIPETVYASYALHKKLLLENIVWCILISHNTELAFRISFIKL